MLERFFPAVAKEEIAQLRYEIDEKDNEIKRMKAYINGLEAGIRAQRRVNIKNEVSR